MVSHHAYCLHCCTCPLADPINTLSVPTDLAQAGPHLESDLFFPDESSDDYEAEAGLAGADFLLSESSDVDAGTPEASLVPQPPPADAPDLADSSHPLQAPVAVASVPQPPPADAPDLPDSSHPLQAPVAVASLPIVRVKGRPRKADTASRAAHRRHYNKSATKLKAIRTAKAMAARFGPAAYGLLDYMVAQQKKPAAQEEVKVAEAVTSLMLQLNDARTVGEEREHLKSAVVLLGKNVSKGYMVKKWNCCLLYTSDAADE